MQKDINGDDILTVKELIDLLQREDPNALVNIEGCDCIGNANEIDSSFSNGEILIKRSN